MPNGKEYPIVLSHGIARFDFLRDSFMKRLRLFLADLSFAPDRSHYFKGIATHLKRHGFETYHTSVSFASGVEIRARELRQEVTQILNASGHEKVHIIGHSMGGLDARHMIVHEGMADKVASLTTIGTPHLGTSFADWGLAHGGEELVEALRLFLNLEGFLTLTIEARAAFNEAAMKSEASNDVFYQTYASSQPVEQIFSPLKPSWKIIHDAEGDNDGLVPVKSQKWTATLLGDGGVVKQVKQHEFPKAADHLNQIGWWDLDELSNIKWWPFRAYGQKKEYETAVKNVYLQIARDVTSQSKT